MSTKRLSIAGVAGVAVVAATLCIAGCGAGRRPPSRPPLAWPAPSTSRAIVIDLTSKTGALNLDPNRNYILRLPRRHVLDVPYGFAITGGHNIVMVGGTLNIERPSGVMELKNQTGTVHIEGVRFTGQHLLEGFDLSEAAGAVVELEHVFIGTVHGSYTTNHADVIQSWAGPRRLLVDGLTGSTTYQGFFLLPNQHYSGPPPQLFDLRNIYIDDSQGAYALWMQTTPRVPLRLSNVYVRANPARPQRDWWLWPKPSSGDRSWTQVKAVRDSPQVVADVTRPAGVRYP